MKGRTGLNCCLKFMRGDIYNMRKAASIIAIILSLCLLAGCRFPGGSSVTGSGSDSDSGKETVSESSEGDAAESGEDVSESGVNTAESKDNASESGVNAAESKDDADKSAEENSSDSKEEQSSASSVQNDPLWSDPDSMKAMVISDLHFTVEKDLDHSLVPGIALAEEITDAIIDEVIDRHPDVLIMTGDNTNSGSSADVAGLTSKLQRLKDAGIRLIFTTGNHDYGGMDAGDYERAYFGLLDPVDRDPDSLSYTSIVKDTVFFAMDDNAVHQGGEGEFSSATMQWLEDTLARYKGRNIVFLSHHNVLFGYRTDVASSNLIQNEELASLLKKYDVRLAMTGHAHFQYILEKDGLWEILSGMPFSGGHLVGNLAVGGDRAVYYAEPIDFASYGNNIAKRLEELDQESTLDMKSVISQLLDQEGLSGSQKKQILKLLGRYFLSYSEGTLMEHVEELLKDPAYEQMIQALDGYNYGPWIKQMIESTAHSSRELEIKLR